VVLGLGLWAPSSSPLSLRTVEQLESAPVAHHASARHTDLRSHTERGVVVRMDQRHHLPQPERTEGAREHRSRGFGCHALSPSKGEKAPADLRGPGFLAWTETTQAEKPRTVTPLDGPGRVRLGAPLHDVPAHLLPVCRGIEGTADEPAHLRVGIQDDDGLQIGKRARPEAEAGGVDDGGPRVESWQYDDRGEQALSVLMPA
jgi:hypothetical protein